MVHFTVDKSKFQFSYLPEYADYLLKNKLHEFVTVGIRFCREADLPLLKPLQKLSEEELVGLSIDSNRETLDALAKNEVAELVENNAQKWISNSMGLIDQHDVTAEDLALGFYLRRKIFAYFLDAYTKNLVEQKFIIAEIDLWTSNEELLCVNIFLQLQRELNNNLAHQRETLNKLLLETQDFVEMGSYLINYKDRPKSIYTPQYFKILELPEGPAYDEFVSKIHPEDRAAVQAAMDEVLKNGGDFESEYRYNGSAGEKRIWSKAAIEMEDGQPSMIKGVIRDITKKHKLISQLQEADAFNKQVQELTLLGNWSWDISSGKLIWSDEIYRIFNVDKSVPMSLGQFLGYVHPDDREKVKKQMETISKPDQPIESVYRIITESGSEKTIHGINKVEAKGKTIVRVYGTCQDITRSYLLRQVRIS